MKFNKHVQKWFENHLSALEISESQSKQLFRIENKLNKLATDECNGDKNPLNLDLELKKAVKICPKLADLGLFYNGDCRGYAMKVKNPIQGMHKDWGGYGIVAPDFRTMN